jgi:hypothetical protein
MRRFFVERLYCDISGDPILMIVDSVPHSQNRLGRDYVPVTFLTGSRLLWANKKPAEVFSLGGLLLAQ